MPTEEAERRERALRAGAAIEAIVRRRIEAFSGPIPDPADGPCLPSVRVDEIPVEDVLLSVWITTRTDAERDTLNSDQTLDSDLRAAMRDSGNFTLDRLHVYVLSQEAIDRDDKSREQTRLASTAIRPILRRRIEAVSGPIPKTFEDDDLPHAMILEHSQQIWLVTRTDAERDALQQDQTLVAEVRAAVRDSGHSSRGAMTVDFESQETIDGRFAGNWWYRLK